MESPGRDAAFGGDAVSSDGAALGDGDVAADDVRTAAVDG